MITTYYVPMHYDYTIVISITTMVGRKVFLFSPTSFPDSFTESHTHRIINTHIRVCLYCIDGYCAQGKPFTKTSFRVFYGAAAIHTSKCLYTYSYASPNTSNK